MKYFLLGLLMIIGICGNASAVIVVDDGGTSVADYVPATIEVEFGSTGVGTLAVAGLYASNDTAISNGTSSAITIATGYCTGTFTGVSALTPGGTYKVTLLPNNYKNVVGATGGFAAYRKSATYPTNNSDLSSPTNQARDSFHFRVKNAAGQVLLEDAAGSTSYQIDASYQFWKGAGYTCATL